MSSVGEGASAMPRGVRLVAGLALLGWLSLSAPLLVGQRTLYLRDVLSNHWPQKSFGAEALKRGEIPAFNPELGLGLPFRGNPGTLAFYPGNVLYLILPFGIAFNAHYVLHWLGAAFAMGWLARRLGFGLPGVVLAALTFGGSGYLLSCLSFYNLIAVVAWWPVVLVAATLPCAARAVGLGGLGVGLALLAGEPVSAAIGVLPLLMVAIDRQGPRRGLVISAGILALGAALAAPQIVATALVLPFSWRGFHGTAGQELTQYALHPARLLELILPLPFGRPDELGAKGWWAYRVAPQMPFFFSLHAGVVGAWLALRGAATRAGRPWALVGLLGLVLAAAGGPLGGWLAASTGGLFRFPEKFLLLFALGLPLAAAAGLEAPARPRRGWILAASVAGLALLALLSWGARGLVARDMGLAAAPPGGGLSVGQVLDTQATVWMTGFALAALILGVAALALRRGWVAVVLLAQLAGLLALRPLVATDESGPYREKPAAVAVLEAARGGQPIAERHLSLVSVGTVEPAWGRLPYRLPGGPKAQIERLHSAALDAAPGVRFGLRYPLHPDSEGLGSPLHTLWRVNLARWPWPRRLPSLRLAGVEAVVAFESPETIGLETIERVERAGAAIHLARVPGVLPPVFWPQRVEAIASPAEAVRRLASLEDPAALALLAEEPRIAHRAGGRVHLLREAPDRLEIDVESEGGILVVQRAFHTRYRVRSGGADLRTQPVDAVLLGIEVPPGARRVEVGVDSRAEVAAGVVAALGWALALALAVRGWPTRRPGGGALEVRS